MSKNYREYKASLLALYAHEGKSPSYKITLSEYKQLKRKIQRNRKKWNKFRRKTGWK